MIKQFIIEVWCLKKKLLQSANDKNFGGGSNDGVFEDVDDDGQSSKVNPIRNFYSQDAR